MGSIQWKRGSAKGAPPGTYQWAIESPDDDENLIRWQATGYIIVTITVMIFLLGILGYILEYFGLWSSGG